LARGCSSIV